MTIYDLFGIPFRIFHKIIWLPVIKSSLGECGNGVVVGRHFKAYGIGNIHMGSDIGIGQDNLFMCTRAKIYIGDHVMTGPNVTMITGGHRYDIKDRPMKSISNDEKLPENDQDIKYSEGSYNRQRHNCGGGGGRNVRRAAILYCRRSSGKNNKNEICG